MEDPPKKFFRLAPGQEVRLKHAYIIKCEQVVKDPATGEIVELRCTYDPETRSGGANSGRKVKGTLHWVSAAHAVPAEIRLYEHLLVSEEADEEKTEDDFIASLNPNSLMRLTNAFVEPSLGKPAVGSKFQFLRQGYFCTDQDTTPDKPVFNRIVGLRDSWAKAKKE
jgi:glutaminyl-tRNA synthetase